MPIVKIIPSKAAPNGLEDYIKNPEKTTDSLYFGAYCDFDNVADSFRFLNSSYGKRALPGRRSYYHIIISWNTRKDHITPEKCREMAEEICQSSPIKDYPHFGTIHTDKDHLHAHIIINNCSLYGKSYQSTRNSTRQLMEISNDLCRKEGFIHSIVDPDKKAKMRLTTAEAQMILKKGKMPWKDLLRYQIDEALSVATSGEDFKRILKERFHVEATQNRKGDFRFLSTDPAGNGGRTKPCPARRLGDKYSLSSLLTTFAENSMNACRKETIHL